MVYNKTCISGLADLECEISYDVPFSFLTTMGVGGLAKVVLLPKSLIELKNCLKCGAPFVVLGGGSNVIASDSGYSGVVIRLFRNFSKVEVCGNDICAYAGASLKKIALLAKQQQVSGFEFAYSLPGSVGGAIVSNSGCFGCEIKDIIKTVYATDGEKDYEFSADECKFGYRTSIFKTNSLVVYKATLCGKPSNSESICALMNYIADKKSSAQPLELRSSGSIFLREGEIIPAQLIEQANLKGRAQGGAQISEKHAGFIVNKGNATFSDVAALIKLAQDEVYKRYKVKLHREVVYIGDGTGDNI